MPTGIYKRTEEQIAQAKKNIEPFIFKEGDRKGIHPATEFKKGHPKPEKAYKFPKEHKINLGRKQTEREKKKKSKTLKKRSNQCSWFIGKTPWNTGTRGVCKPNSGSFKKGTPMEKHPRWLGGISFEPYSVDWTETLRRSIRERDHYICQLCGQYGNTVHHIDYDKKNCNPENLITLCNHCNIKVNKNRDCWTKHFNK